MEAADRIRGAPEVALVLGSGMGDLARKVRRARAVEGADIEGWPRSDVRGHRGRLVFGEWEGRRVVVQQGRVHRYEGRSVAEVTFAVRFMHALGARHLVVTNAAGGINPALVPGMLMLIADHVNLEFTGGSGRRRLYDAAWLERTADEALRSGVPARKGVYLRTLGPSYETPAEIRAFARLGADAVGMSTVDEVVAARELGMRVLGISTITNAAAGLTTQPVTHDEVLETGARVTSHIQRLVSAALRTI